MKKSILNVVVMTLGLQVAGTVLADTPAAANAAATATPVLSNAFTASKAVAVSKLSGAVTNVSVQGLGNVATMSNSSANGGNGGAANGGTGNGGNGTGGSNSGSGGAASTSGATGGSGGSAAGQGNGATGSGGGVGGVGSAGGTTSVTTGSMNLSNTLSNVATSAAGIVTISQNTGIGALVQQSINVQANLATGK